MVTWGWDATTLSYRQAGANTETVAKVISELAERILKPKIFNSKLLKIFKKFPNNSSAFKKYL